MAKIEFQIPAGRKAQLDLAGRLFRPEAGGELNADGLKNVVGEMSDTVGAVMAGGAAPEPAAGNPTLIRFEADYERWDSSNKRKVTLMEVKRRLLADNKHFLYLAETMHEGGVMFGVDIYGRILFADGGLDPTNMPHRGLTYVETRKAVMFKKDNSGKDVPTGYEMFPLELVGAFERFTGQPFVKSPNGDEHRSSWIESGIPPVIWTLDACYDPDGNRRQAVVGLSAPWTVSGNEVWQDMFSSRGGPFGAYPLRGVRRLLRVR